MGLKVTQVRSGIGTRPAHRGTLRALGLGRIGKSNVLPDRPEIRGMIARVPHLVSVEDVAQDPTPRPRASGARRRAATITRPDEEGGQA
jgi:large subunit ribosomal protein L30